MGTIQIDGSTPKLTIGNATAEDALILFDGNAQDFHIGLDDTADDLVIGVGSALGTTTALAIDENAGSTFSGTVTVGVDDTGKDVKFFGATSGKYWLWDESADGVVQIGTLTVGVDDTGHDVKFFGATASSYMLWDESADDLNLIASGIGVGTAKDLGVGVHIRTADSGAGVDGGADELIVEGSGHAGLSILTGTSNIGRIAFGDSGDNGAGIIQYDHANNSLDFFTSGTEHLSIDSAGHVTMPLQPAFSAQSNSTLSNVPTNNAVQTIPFGTEIFDLNADYNNSNYTFTAPVTGKYLLTFCAVLANVDKDANYIICAIRTSNRNYGDGNMFGLQQNSGDEPRVEISQTILADMDANDTATVGVQQYEGAAQMDITDDTAFFMGHLVA
jgi:hypothetical protein